MQIVKKTHHSKTEVKKSTFLGFLLPYSQFHSFYKKLKEEHPKANHIVWAYRFLNEQNQVVENSSDDGEPKGTSGPPVLNVMRGNELVQSAILVVRYFGGIKLGTGGLVRAYGSAAKEVIECSFLYEYVKKEALRCYTPYAFHDRFEHFVKKESLHVEHKEFKASGVSWDMEVSATQKEMFLEFAQAFLQEGVSIEE